ncbi:ABC transporter substrate-binding protein [Microbacterium enclense]|uniref:ABC transporter substrate-binding protein n=1 Tax=Microbacterium enclense TaxID=993073 RepID=UPI0021A91DEF|nr:ABC transporter substrate-binding protein [Microbacterium enclense]MCT2086856.1 ABC transporter substrate-binding protein [Microbacterium enclense]
MHHGQYQQISTTSRRRLTRLVVLTVAATVALAGCAAPEPAPEEEPPPPTTLTLGVVGTPTSFNAATAHGATAPNRAVSALLDERLGSLDGDLQVVPNNGLGRITRIEGDPLTVSYELFADRVWSDGTPITLDDLMFGWAVSSHYFDDATYDETGAVVAGTRYFESATPPDPNARTSRPTMDRTADTLTLTYDEPFADWNRQWLLDRPVHVVAAKAGVTVKDLMTAILTTPAGDPTAPVEPNPVLAAAAAAWNTGFDASADGTFDVTAAVVSGPWTVAEATGSAMSLVRRDNYQGGHYPALESMTIRFFPDRAAQVAAVAAGEVDVANIGDPDAEELKTLADAGVTVTTGPTAQTMQVRFADTTSDELRRAVSLALDRGAIVEEAVGEVRPDARPLQSFLSSPATGSTYQELTSGNGAPGTGSDVGAARAALDDRPAVLRVAHDSADPVSASVFAQMVTMGAEAGIAVRAAAENEIPDATLAWIGEDESLYRSARDRLAEGVTTADAEETFAEMTRDTDPVDVLAGAREIDRALFEAYAGIPLLERTGAVAVANGVGGVTYTSEPDGVPPSFWTWTPPAS